MLCFFGIICLPLQHTQAIALKGCQRCVARQHAHLAALTRQPIGQPAANGPGTHHTHFVEFNHDLFTSAVQPAGSHTLKRQHTQWACSPTVCGMPQRLHVAPSPSKVTQAGVSASSNNSTQWRTGVSVPLCKWVMQPMLADTISCGASSARCPSLRSRSSYDSLGLSTE